MISLDVTSSEEIRFLASNSTPAFETFITTETLNSGKETIVALIFNAGSVKIYFDNIEKKSDTFSLIAIPAYTQDWISWSDGNGIEEFEGFASYLYAFDTALTQTEVSQLTGELENIKYPTKVTGRSKADSDIGSTDFNEIADGDMEDAGTSSWTVFRGANSKESGSATGTGSQVLRITRSVGEADGLTYQEIDNNKTYTVSGYYRTSGADVTLARCGSWDNGSLFFSDSSQNTDWKYFNTTVFFSASQPRITFNVTGSEGCWVEFDNILVQETGKTYLDVQFKTDFGALANEATVSSGFLENTPFQVNSGSYKVIDDTIGGETVKAIECATAGKLYILSSYFQESLTNAAYGDFEWYQNKQTGSDTRVQFISDNIGIAANGYRVDSSSLQVLTLVESGVAVLITSGTDVTPGSWESIKVTRASDGAFELFLNGTSVGTATDNTTTASTYLVFDLDAGDKISLGNLRGDKGVVKK